jgi:hypothetical protein
MKKGQEIENRKHILSLWSYTGKPQKHETLNEYSFNAFLMDGLEIPD